MFKSAINRMAYFERMSPVIFAYFILPVFHPIPDYMHWLAVLIVVAMCVLICKFTAQRLKDMGRGPWISLLMIVPLVNLCIGIWCLTANTKEVTTPLAEQSA